MKTFYASGHILKYFAYGEAPPAVTFYLGLLTDLTPEAEAEVPFADNYGRVELTSAMFDEPDSGYISNLESIDFPIPSDDWPDVVGFGIYDDATAGNLWRAGYFTTDWREIVIVRNATQDVRGSTTYADDSRVVFYPIGSNSAVGLVAHTLYYVINSTGPTFQISLTQGGSAVTVGDDILYAVPVAIITPVAGQVPRIEDGGIYVGEF